MLNGQLFDYNNHIEAEAGDWGFASSGGQSFRVGQPNPELELRVVFSA
jgi:hypothetical protein